MTEAELRRRLSHDPVPGENEAGRRAWDLVREAFVERERVPRIERGSRPLIAVAIAAVVAVSAITPPGRAFVERLRDAVGRSPSQPALVRLPAPGRVLVVSDSGVWVVHRDGSKRLLGAYDDASWSPRGLFVVAVQGNHLATVDPERQHVRWSLSRNETIKDPRWSGGGFDTRIAYRAGTSLHVVAGDGSPDTVVATHVAPIAPAWQPDSHVLAYASRDGRVHVVDVDTRGELWATEAIPDLRGLSFHGRFLVARTRANARLYGRHGLIRFAAAPALSKGRVLLDVVALPSGEALYSEYDPSADATAIVLTHCFAPDPCLAVGPAAILRVPGEVENVTLSPDGRWLAAGWPAADQLLFFRVGRFNKMVAVSNVSREFEPGGQGKAEFPRLAGWAPEAP